MLDSGNYFVTSIYPIFFRFNLFYFSNFVLLLFLCLSLQNSSVMGFFVSFPPSAALTCTMINFTLT